MSVVNPRSSQIKAFHHAESNFFSLISGSCLECEHMIAFASEVQASGLNPVFLTQPIDESCVNEISSCRSFYMAKKIPWAFIVPEYFYGEHINGLLQKQRLFQVDIGVAMVLSLPDFIVPSAKNSLQIKIMEDDLQTWSIPLIYGFESTPEITGVYTQCHQLAALKNNKLYHFSGFINETVVSSLSLSLSGHNARIDDVATMPDQQKKGYATELIYTALQYLQQLKIETCFLEASSSGLTTYERIGFKVLFKNYYYEYSKEHP
ncbi:GNAT family N-acetyltransferase [Legionella fallonii]|uniref:Acetyltransferase n=1 Tax=Legionella fallonii LLAP-10 TaxID=1212491 RepID=A0A098GAK6_9GAMM|nr:GNAT family N-acetyltransferase [Legionella fallonii]CEG58515.1 Acetyltransferase [Legionella fallonii LLAP-10]